MDRPHYYQAFVNGEPRGEPDVRPSDTVWAIHERGEPIPQVDYDLMVKQAQWDRDYGPGMPDPYRRAELRKMPTRF